jgi:hypothetical protein
MALIRQISPQKNPQIARFYDKFHQVAKNIERFSHFSTFISRMWPNLAK